MTPLALAALIRSALRRLAAYTDRFLAGIREAREMALLYNSLAGMSDRDLARRGLKRQDIPRAVLTSFGAARR